MGQLNSQLGVWQRKQHFSISLQMRNSTLSNSFHFAPRCCFESSGQKSESYLQSGMRRTNDGRFFPLEFDPYSHLGIRRKRRRDNAIDALCLTCGQCLPCSSPPKKAKHKTEIYSKFNAILSNLTSIATHWRKNQLFTQKFPRL